MEPPLTRRAMLARTAAGFGGTALSAMLAAEATRAAASTSDTPQGVRARPRPHFPPTARSVIFLYMDGGPSQMDTFDPKPTLTRHHGKSPGDFFDVAATQFNDNGVLLASPWKFRRHGESGLAISELLPHVAKCADDLCVVRSLTSEFSEHTAANYFLHTGLGLVGRPSMGAWTVYGLGSENENLPGFVVLDGGLTPPGGLGCFGSGFLPATYQGSTFRPGPAPVANIHPAESSPVLQRNKLDLVRAIDQTALQYGGGRDAFESAIANYELGYRMQAAVPELTDLSKETEGTKTLYGMNHPYEPTKIYGAQCLMARRLVERGVRFIELTCPKIGGNDRWDQHSNLRKGHEDNALAVDRPIAALLADLKQRGLLDSTLVIWGGEFGRTPFAQGTDGRDHNPFGYSVWLAGGGVLGGMTYGATDEFGYRAIENRLEMYDLHATMLHLLGLDHTRLTVRFSGRDMRLTDVHGKVVRDIIA